MLIRMNDTQQVKIDFNFFSSQEHDYIDLFLRTELDRFQTETNRTCWDHRLVDNTDGVLYVTQIRDDEFVDFIVQRVVSRFNTTTDISKYSVVHYKSEGQYNVNWHDDGSFVGAVSIYLNKEWNRTLGGHFIFQMSDEDVMTAIQPKRGTAVYQCGGVLHATTPIAKSAPSRQSIQVFINE